MERRKEENRKGKKSMETKSMERRKKERKPMESRKEGRRALERKEKEILLWSRMHKKCLYGCSVLSFVSSYELTR